MNNSSDSYFLSERSYLVETSEIRKVFQMASSMKNPKDLSIGQPCFPVPEEVKEAMIQAIRDNKNNYTETQGIMPLREAISQRYAKHNIDIHVDNIQISTGVASLLLLLYNIIFDPGDQVLLLDPYFLIYETLNQFHKLDTLYLPENFTEHDVQALIASKRIQNLKAIIFSSPSNPTGKILSRQQIQLLGKLATDHQALLVSDEIYSSYDYDNKFIHCASLFPDKTITLDGFSKSHSMTGLRVGFAVAPQNLQYIIERMSALQQYSIVCAPHPAQWGAVKALEIPIHDQINKMRQKRDLVLSYLKNVTTFPNPEGAFYVFPTIFEDSQLFITKAIKHDLLVVPGYIFSKNRKTIRISYAQDDSILEEGLKLFCELLHK